MSLKRRVKAIKSFPSLKSNASTTDITLANSPINPAGVAAGTPQSYLYVFREDGDHQNNFGYIYSKVPSSTAGLRIYHGSGVSGQLSIAFGATSSGLNGSPNVGSAPGSPGYSRSIWSASLITTDGTINASGVHIYTAPWPTTSLVEVSSYTPNTSGGGSITLDTTNEPHIANRKGGNRSFNGLQGYISQFNRVISVTEANEILRRGFDRHDPTLTLLFANGHDYSIYGASQLTAIAGMDVGTAAPWPLLRANARRRIAAASGAILAGNAADIATATAALTTQITPAAAALVVASSTASLSSQISLEGAAVDLSVANGALTAQIKFSGDALAQALASAAMSAGIQMVTAAQDQATASGSLSSGIDMAVQAISQAAASGSLATAIDMLVAAVANAGASGSITAQIQMNTAALAQALAAADLSTSAGGTGLASDAADIASSSATLTASIQMTAESLAQAIATGGMTAQIMFDADALSQAGAPAALTAQIAMGSTAQAVASAPATLTAHPALVSDPRFVVNLARRDNVVRLSARNFTAAANQRDFRVAA